MGKTRMETDDRTLPSARSSEEPSARAAVRDPGVKAELRRDRNIPKLDQAAGGFRDIDPHSWGKPYRTSAPMSRSEQRGKRQRCFGSSAIRRLAQRPNIFSQRINSPFSPSLTAATASAGGVRRRWARKAQAAIASRYS